MRKACGVLLPVIDPRPAPPPGVRNNGRVGTLVIKGRLTPAKLWTVRLDWVTQQLGANWQQRIDTQTMPVARREAADNACTTRLAWRAAD